MANTKQVENTKLKKMVPIHGISEDGLKKVYTRHYANMGLILPPDEYVLFNWLVFMSDSKCRFQYSTLLLNQFNRASKRFCEINNVDKIHYKIWRYSARESFISLIEKGYVLRISAKQKFMINPMVVNSGIFGLLSRKKMQDEYLEFMKRSENEDVSELLKEWCDKMNAYNTLQRKKYEDIVLMRQKVKEFDIQVGNIKK